MTKRTHETPHADDINNATKEAKARDRQGASEALDSEDANANSVLPLTVTYDDFVGYSPTGQYIFRPNGTLWPAKVVNARLPWKGRTPPSVWLFKHASVEQMTWMPGAPEIVRHRLLLDGGWVPREGARVFNLYRPPANGSGDAASAGPWLELVRKLWPDDADLVIDWFAHRVQHADTKTNHALLLGGDFGIGKDTVIEPLLQAIGPWNAQTISPSQFVGRFNGHLKSVVLRIAEARASDRFDRFAFYEFMKLYGAAPPEAIRIDEKNLREYTIVNIVGIIITANSKSAFYLEPGDRRHAVVWSRCHRADFSDGYFDELWRWYHAGGFAHVTAYLAQHDLSHFNPKSPPRKTAAFHEIVNSNRSTEDAELADVLEKLRMPTVVTVAMVRGNAPGDFAEWLGDRKNRRLIAHRFANNGYEPVPNPDASDGVWKIGGQRQVVYGQAGLDHRTLLDAVRDLREGTRRS